MSRHVFRLVEVVWGIKYEADILSRQIHFYHPLYGEVYRCDTYTPDQDIWRDICHNMDVITAFV